jgi:AcrR family transcriptional regulator
MTAAREIFAEQGASATVAAIAQRAGVGPATLFRRFPTKRDLLLAVIADKLDMLAAEARAAAAEPDPAAGLRRFFVAACTTTARDQALLDLAHETVSDPGLTEAREAIFDAMSTLARRGKEAGVIRNDIEGTDLAVLMNAIAYGVRGLADTNPDAHLRYIEIVLAGLRPSVAEPPEPTA